MKNWSASLLLSTLFTSIFCGYGKIMLAVSIISSVLFIGNAKGLRLDVYNKSNDITYSHTRIVNIQGATDGDDGGDDLPYNDGNPNILHIYSHNYYSGLDYFVDARGSNSTTTYDLHLKNTGFSGTADNMLTFVMKDDSNFKCKNIFLGDANDSNDIVADIKYIIDNGSVLPPPYNNHYGDFSLPPVDGSKTGVYDKRKVFFFNHADLNRDREVDFGDLEIFARNWARDERAEPNDPNNTLGTCVGKDPNDLDPYSDINRDRVVDFKDFSLFSGEWVWDANDPNTWSRVR